MLTIQPNKYIARINEMLKFLDKREYNWENSDYHWNYSIEKGLIITKSSISENEIIDVIYNNLMGTCRSVKGQRLIDNRLAFHAGMSWFIEIDPTDEITYLT